MKAVAIAIALLLLALGCSGTPAERPPRLKCEAGCAVSFAELVPNRAEYDGEEIYISGYLALSYGRLALQPSKSAYLSGTGDIDAIIFRMPASMQKRIIDSHLNNYVSVRGVFRVGSGHDLVGIGHFDENAEVLRKIVREEPEGLDQWRVPIEELDELDE